MLSDVTLPLFVDICDITFAKPIAVVFTLNVIVLPLAFVVNPVPPARVIEAVVLAAVTSPSSADSCLINGVDTPTAEANVATLTLLDTAVPDVLVVTTNKSLFDKLLAAVSSVSFGIIYPCY